MYFYVNITIIINLILKNFMKIIIQIIKITSLALIFALIFNIANSYFNGWSFSIPSSSDKIEIKQNKTNNNKYKFKKSNSIILAKSGVALSTNIGIKYKQRQIQNLYKNVPKIAKIISEKKYSNNTNLTSHLLKIREYSNVLRTDIKKMIDSSYNKRETLDAYIEQLKYRYNSANFSSRILVKKKAELSENLNSASLKISLLKKEIETNFKGFNSKAVEKNIDELLISKAEFNYAKTHIIFINQYLKYYANLNNSNKKLLDTLINNKEAIIKNTKIIIPDTWIWALKKLDLIVDEKNYKSK